MLSPYFAPSHEGITVSVRYGCQRPGCSFAFSLLRMLPVPIRFVSESIPAPLSVIPNAPEHIILMGAALH